MSLPLRCVSLSERIITKSVPLLSKRCFNVESKKFITVAGKKHYNNNNNPTKPNNMYVGLSGRRCYSQHPAPDTGSRNRLIWMVYFSGFLGAFMLIAVLRREYRKYQRRKRGIEVLNIPSFGHRLFICKYKGSVLMDTVGQNIEEVEKFAVRDDDIWLVGWPRSGTTWSQQIIYLINTGLDFEGAQSSSLDDRFPFLEFRYPGYDAVAKYPSPRMIKTHLPFHLLPGEIHVKKPKIIYIARNPKDVIVSYYHFIKMLLPFRFNGQFPEFFTLFMNNLVPYSSWFEHVRDFWEHRHDENILFIKYEDLQKDLRGTIREIAQFLGKSLTEDQVTLIADHCTFHRMKNNENVNHTWFENFGLKRKGEADFIRKGKIGDWKNYLTAEMSGRVDKLVEQKLGDTGLEFQYEEAE